jgi:iron complex transport system ATP-binding protein
VEVQVLDLLRGLDGNEHPGLLMVLHDINQASFYADRIIAMKNGRILADGPPEQVVTQENVQTLFGVNMRILRSQKAGRLYCLPEHL